MCAVKKILFVYHVSSIGGGSYCLLNILKSLDRTSVKPYVLLRNDGPLVEEIRKLDIEVHFLPEMRTVPYNRSMVTVGALVNAYHIIHSFKAFKEIVSKLDVDAVYLNTMMLYPYLRQAQELGKRTIIHVREHWPKNEHKWQRRQAIEHIKKFANQIVAINKYSASMLEERAKDVCIVYDWIDIQSRFKEIPLDVIFGENSNELKVYLYTGGMQRIKGAVEVLEAFINVVRDPKARLLIVGVDPVLHLTGLKGMIKKVLSKLGVNSYEIAVKKLISIDKRIVCIPSTYYITYLMQQAYCNLSYFSVPHANLALAECEIVGTPSVAAMTEESIEYSLNGELSVLFEMNNKEEFHKAIHFLNDNYDSICKSLNEKSLLVEQMFSPTQNINKLNDFLNNINTSC